MGQMCKAEQICQRKASFFSFGSYNAPGTDDTDEHQEKTETVGVFLSAAYFSASIHQLPLIQLSFFLFFLLGFVLLLVISSASHFSKTTFIFQQAHRHCGASAVALHHDQ